MMMTGLFRFALLPGVEPESFEEHRTDKVFTNPHALQLTRITRRFNHQLLSCRFRRPGNRDQIDPNPGRQYVWQAMVELQTNSGYDFEENADSVQERVAQFAVLVAVESYAHVES
jgi:hypothetical protein